MYKCTGCTEGASFIYRSIKYAGMHVVIHGHSPGDSKKKD